VMTVEDPIKSGINLIVSKAYLPSGRDAVRNACVNFVSKKHLFDADFAPQYGGGADLFSEYSREKLELKEFSSGQTKVVAVSGYPAPEGTTETCLLWGYDDDSDSYSVLLKPYTDAPDKVPDINDPALGEEVVPKWYGFGFDTRIDAIPSVPSQPVKVSEAVAESSGRTKPLPLTFTRLEGRDAEGTDYSMQKGISIDRCEGQCTAESRCIAYTFALGVRQSRGPTVAGPPRFDATIPAATAPWRALLHGPSQPPQERLVPSRCPA
jgi:hypothetical protein